MKPHRFLLTLLLAAHGALLSAQPTGTNPAPAPTRPAFPGQLSPEERQRQQQLTNEDHADMMAQLGIKTLRPGRNGSTAPGTPNPANYDQAKANPYPDYPDALTLKNGQKVTSAETWWKLRRPEIVEDFEREVVGRVPKNVPGVTWKVTRKVETKVGGLPVVAKEVIGHVDTSACPGIAVDIKMAVVTPANARAPVPVLMMFGFGNMPGEGGNFWFGATPPPADPPSTD
ncbi:MAG TPA: hypothetical protein VMC06_10690, partial [Opitutaceae bacterium]|nr:hypothetical protein [Opitutaceae bacterium]